MRLISVFPTQVFDEAVRAVLMPNVRPVGGPKCRLLWRQERHL